jgi:hypothetical protein
MISAIELQGGGKISSICRYQKQTQLTIYSGDSAVNGYSIAMMSLLRELIRSDTGQGKKW